LLPQKKLMPSYPHIHKTTHPDIPPLGENLRIANETFPLLSVVQWVHERKPSCIAP
jgi:hypothetical protein